MRIAVIGAGGVGGYFGGRLAEAGNDVVFVARGRQFEAIRDRGLTVHSPRGDIRLARPAVVPSVGDLGDVDLTLVAVKLWDTEEVARQLPPVVARGSAVLSLQNGVTKDDVLRSVLPADAVLGAVCYISAFIEEPGVIRHNSPLQRLVFGDYEQSAGDRTSTFLAACREAGIDAEVSDDIEREIWQKYVFLVGLSAATASTRLTLGPILAHPGSRAFLHGVMREVVDVARARGVALADDYADQQLAACEKLPADMTSSMYHDLVSGHRLELPWLSGHVVAAARDAGIDAPRNRAVAEILSPFENPGA